MWEQLGGAPASNEWINRLLSGVDAAVFPGVDVKVDLPDQMKRFVDGVRAPLVA